MEKLPRKYLARAEMMKRVARFKDLKGFDGGLPDSKMPGSIRTLFNVIGFQPPDDHGDERDFTGRRRRRKARRHQDQRGLQPRLLQGQARQRADDAQSRHQRDLHLHDRQMARELGR